MSILPLHKVSLCGLLAEKGAVLEALQGMGCLHLVSLQAQPREPEAAAPAHAEDAYKALRYLLATPRKRHPVREDVPFEAVGVVGRVLENQQRLREVTDRCDFLAHRIKQLEPWGEFSFPPEQELAGYRLWFYVVPYYEMKKLASLELPWQEVHRDPRNAYVVLVSRDEPLPDALPVPRTHTGALSLRELRGRLNGAEVELDEVVAEREALTRWIFLLSQNMARAEDRAALRHAAEQTLDEEGVFAVQGWLPMRDLPELQRFADERGLALLDEPPGPDDAPPTLLDNPPNLAGGQDVVSFYQTPGYRSWDPSSIVFFSFAIFFAMILADAGYALVIGAILASSWRRMGESPTGTRLRILGAFIVGASVLYGIFSGSYFGISPPEGSLLGQAAFLDLQDFDTMMRLSVTIGCAHLVLANGIIATHAPSWSARAAPLGWIGVILAGLFVWLAESEAAPEALRDVGIGLGAAGLAAILFFSGQRPLREPKDVLRRLLDGLLGWSNLSKIFGDVLSYMRLWALGLASASLAVTFNQLAREVSAAMPGLGLLVSLLILLVGHTLNLSLGIMSGMVHGLRLNFIEFFNWGLPEEGVPFQSFAKKEIES